MRYDFVPASELALRITAATVEDFATPGPTFEYLALFAFRACHAGLGGLRLEPLDAVAIRIAGTSQEFAETRALANHRASALVAGLISRFERSRFAYHDFALLVVGEFL